MGGVESLLDRPRAFGYGDVAGLAAFLECFHVIDRGVPEEVALVLVEGGGEAGEGWVARIEPAGALEAVPGLGLDDHMCAGNMLGEVGGDDAPESGQDGRDAESAELIE